MHLAVPICVILSELVAVHSPMATHRLNLPTLIYNRSGGEARESSHGPWLGRDEGAILGGWHYKQEFNSFFI